jgi:hypothetical protein
MGRTESMRDHDVASAVMGHRRLDLPLASVFAVVLIVSVTSSASVAWAHRPRLRQTQWGPNKKKQGENIMCQSLSRAQQKYLDTT